MNKQLIGLVIFLLCTSANAQELDITDYLTGMINCQAKEYRPDEDEFSIDEFNAAWATCAPSREALLSVLPEEMHPEWEAKFELMRTSLISRFQPQPAKKGYGLNPENPVMIGGLKQGAQRTYAYFSRLKTPDGRAVRVRRIGSCCRFKTPNALIGDHAPLDKYELTSQGEDSTTIVYVNIYDEGTVESVTGFVLGDDT